MSDYTITRSTHKTLTANEVDTVTLDMDYLGVEVKNRGTDPIYFLVDPVDAMPTVEGDGTFVVTAGEALTVDSSVRPDPYQAQITAVRLISVGAAAYSVTGLR